MSKIDGKAPRRDTGLRHSEKEFIKPIKSAKKIDDEINPELLAERSMLVKELKETIKATNKYKSSTYKLMAYIHETDPIISEIKTEIFKVLEIFNKIKNKELVGDKFEIFCDRTKPSIRSFLEQGTSLCDKNSIKLQRSLLHANSHIYKKMNDRKMEYVPKVKKLIRNLKEKVLDDKYSVFKEDEAKLENLSQQLHGVFQNFDNLQNRDIVILGTIFNNFNKTERGSVGLSNMLENVGEKIEKMMDRVLAQSDLGDNVLKNEENLISNYATGRKNLEVLEDMTGSQFREWDTYKQQNQDANITNFDRKVSNALKK